MSGRHEPLPVEEAPLAGLVRDVLAARGFSARVVSDALQGVLEARRPKPALVLLDRFLPAGRGSDVLYRLRTAPETAGIPVVILTGAPEAQVRAKGSRRVPAQALDGWGPDGGGAGGLGVLPTRWSTDWSEGRAS